MLGSLQDTLVMSQDLPGVKPCIDFAHLHARPGDGSVNSYGEWCGVLETYGQALGDESLRNLHAHISGIDYGGKGEKEHLALEDSDLDLAAVLRALKDFGCRGRLLCESPVMEEDALKIQAAWLEISGETRE
jgi:deoxyribonuclease-4